MKKKLIVSVVILLVIGLLTRMLYGYHQWKKARSEKIEQIILSIEYREQNTAFGMSINDSELGYQEYDKVNEKELYVCLEVYNSWNKQKNNGREVLYLTDIEDYLSSEYNEDGSLRVYSRPEKIQEYMNWYYADGNRDVEKYWDGLERILSDYKIEHPEIAMKIVKDINTEQLQELINKYNDPSYEINAEIMGEME